MDGILLINKESGMTSHDVVFKLRKILNTKKIGHTGTLDPDATGVLLVLVGKACKILPFLEDTDKEYIAELKLGEATDTEDCWGKVIETKPILPIENFEELLKGFEGKQKQLPPMISSIKVNGKKLYEYARSGETVERPLRDIEIYETEVLDAQKYRFRAACSSGTYIRSLCRDLAVKSGNIGCMSSLVRTRVGRFTLDQCVTLSEVSEGNYKLFPIKEALCHLPMINIENPADVLNGKRMRLNCSAERVVLLSNDEVLAIYEREKDTIYRSVRGLW